MDRNHLDLNRLSQVSANAPWFLEMILERLADIVARHRHATILVVHGWNVIQARVDLGLGLRRHGDQLRPPGAARVSASDAFIHGAARRTGRRSSARMESSPASGCDIRAAARRICCRRSPIGISRARLPLCANYPRWRRGIRSMRCNWSFQSRSGCPANCAGDASRRSVRCSAIPRSETARATRDGKLVSRPIACAESTRSGKTCDNTCDADAGRRSSYSIHQRKLARWRVSISARAASGARIMMLLAGGRVALFTGEGKPTRDGNRLSLGPLALESQHRRTCF